MPYLDISMAFSTQFLEEHPFITLFGTLIFCSFVALVVAHLLINKCRAWPLKVAGDGAFRLGQILLMMAMLFALGEIYFYLKNDDLYFNKSQLRLNKSVNIWGVESVKTDTSLADKDYSENILILANNPFRNQPVTLSPNSQMTVRDDVLILETTDGSPGFAEIDLMVNTHPAFQNNPYPYFLTFSAWVEAVPAQDTQPYLAVSYLSTVSESPHFPGFISPGLSTFITVFPGYDQKLDILFDAEHRAKNSQEILKLRIHFQSKTTVRKSMLYASRQYGMFPSPVASSGNTSRFTSAMGVFPQKINFRKNPNYKRVLFIGGSTTYGANYSTLQGTVPKWFAAKLDSVHPDMFEVFNAGMNSASTTSLVNGLDRRRLGIGNDRIVLLPEIMNKADYIFDILSFNYLDMKPDFIFIAPVYNDLIGSPQIDPENLRPSLSNTGIYMFLIQNRTARFLTYNFAVGSYVYTYFKEKYQRDIIGQVKKGYNSDTVRIYKNNLDFAISTLKNAGVKVYLMAYPNPSLYADKPTFGDLNYSFYFERLKNFNAIDEDVIKEAAQHHGVPYVDLRTYFRDFPQEYYQEIYTGDFVHLTSKGNALVADLLWNAVHNDFNPN